MTDKELIELAAKAAGLHVKVSSNSGMGLKVHGNCNWWNPLTDDGDALRLAVKLELEVSLGQFGTIIYPRHGKVEEIGEDGCDEMALCRRAITRAAAQIGKEMK